MLVVAVGLRPTAALRRSGPPGGMILHLAWAPEEEGFTSILRQWKVSEGEWEEYPTTSGGSSEEHCTLSGPAGNPSEATQRRGKAQREHGRRAVMPHWQGKVDRDTSSTTPRPDKAT